MGYKNNNEYIIENDVDEIDNISFQKTMKKAAQVNNSLPDGYEIDEAPTPQVDRVAQEIRQAAEDEGLVSDEEYLGGENASPEEVIKAMKEEGLSKGAIKKQEEHEEKQLNDFKVVTATRSLLLSRVQKTIPVHIPIIIEETNENGELVEVPVNMEFKIKRLTEAENTHILNHKLIGKEIYELTDEEYVESSQFRSKVLATAVVEPKMTAEQWANECDNAVSLELYNKINKIITESDDVSRFQ